MVVKEQFQKMRDRAENWIVGTVRKYGYPPFGRRSYRGRGEEYPAYERQFSPFWIKSIAERQALVNNAIEEKVNQAFRRGFTDWQESWAAKCPNCKREYETLQPFVDQFPEDEDVDTDDIDLTKKRPCPQCDSVEHIKTPDPEDRDEAQQMFDRANMSDGATELLPKRQSSVSQNFIGVCREVAWDIQTFDDGWMIFHRRYYTNKDGKVIDWDFEGVYRAPPYVMRYSTDDDGKMGNEYWICVDCRASSPEDYQPEQSPGRCPECGNRTYECFAYMLNEPNGEPQQFFIQGEFAHDSEFRPTRLYGLSPIISLSDETQTIQKMDAWYRSAYEKRRAPRGAIVISSSNKQATRAWNQEQMQNLNADSQHIPVFMDDTEGGGNPIMWQPLLESPAEMQQMEMRNWFSDRIAAKYGVTSVFQNSSTESSGMSQSLEIVVTNRAVERLQRVFEDTFIPAFIGNIEAPGWEKHLESPEEEDDQAEAQLVGRHLQNARTAQDIGFDIEWTRDDDLDVKSAMIEAPEEGEGEEGDGLAGLFGGSTEQSDEPNDPVPNTSPVNSAEADEEFSNPSDRPTQEEDDIDPAGTTGGDGGRPRDPNEMSGQPRDERKPSTEEPYRRSDGTVTTSTEGYSNAVYGGPVGETIDILRDVRESDDMEKATKIDKIEHAYQTCVSESDGSLPNFEIIEGSVRNRPDTDYRAFKRQNPGNWTQYVDADLFVRDVYQSVEEIINGE